tara:strand:+ start:200 stop:565 length:366 start_codon:yes stop_codon:yes gene_type:complete
MDDGYIYRAFGNVTYSPLGLTGEREATVEIVIDQLKIIRPTPAGAWISHPLTGVEKWVATNGRKRFACPTKDEAMESLKQRNRRHLQHLSAAIRKATDIREALEHGEYDSVMLSDGVINFN